VQRQDHGIGCGGNEAKKNEPVNFETLFTRGQEDYNSRLRGGGRSHPTAWALAERSPHPCAPIREERRWNWMTEERTQRSSESEGALRNRAPSIGGSTVNKRTLPSKNISRYFRENRGTKVDQQEKKNYPKDPYALKGKGRQAPAILKQVTRRGQKTLRLTGPSCWPALSEDEATKNQT